MTLDRGQGPVAPRPAHAGQGGAPSPERTAAAVPPGGHARSIDVRLARLHLRVGLLALARAELETMAGDGTLDVPAIADLAEVRWRTGDLPGAGDAARAHISSGGREPIAWVIAAEAYAAQGRTADAQRMAADVLARDVDVDSLFAGETRSGVWQLADARRGAGRSAAEAGRHGEREGTHTASAAPRGRDDVSPAIGAARMALRARDPAGVASRLAVALRADLATVAEDVLDIADEALRDAGRLDAAALLLIRGDALTLLGRREEAADAYRASNRALGVGAREETP